MLKRNKAGPRHCPSCKQESESIYHLFIDCPFCRAIWGEVMAIAGKHQRWEGRSVGAAWDVWWHESTEENRKALPLIISWGVWLARNRAIF